LPGSARSIRSNVEKLRHMLPLLPSIRAALAARAISGGTGTSATKRCSSARAEATSPDASSALARMKLSRD
jgi:hypothetical protein